jgi:hypothetical protein
VTADAFADHFAASLCAAAPDHQPLPTIRTPRVAIPADVFTPAELRNVTASMGTHKAPGPDGVAAEVWAQPSTHPVLLAAINDMVERGRVPQELRTGIIVPIFKGKGDAQLPSGYRPVVLLPTALKIVHKLILYRVRVALEPVLMLYQAAFREGLSTSMHIAALCELQARARAGGHAVHACFCDFRDAD